MTELNYDDLTPSEQEKVREQWEKQIPQRISELNYEEKFKAEGRPWSEADDQGNVVTRS